MFAVAEGAPWLGDVAARWRRRARFGWHAWHAGAPGEAFRDTPLVGGPGRRAVAA
jgi:hypothetical protein